MHFWGRSSNEGKCSKPKNGCGVDTDPGKLRIVWDEKGERSRTPTTDGHSSVNYQCTSPSHQVSCSQPIPVQGRRHPKATQLIDSVIGRPIRTGRERDCRPSLFCSFSKFEHIVDREDRKYMDTEFGTASDVPYNSNGCENINHRHLKKTTNCLSSLKLKDKSAMGKEQDSRELNNQTVSISPKIQSRGEDVFKRETPPISASPRVIRREPSGMSGYFSINLHGNTPLLSSRHHPTPGSGHISEQSYVGGDVPELIYRQHDRSSTERFITQGHTMASVGPSSRVDSEAGPSLESLIVWPRGRKKHCYRLPCPPATISNHVPMSPSYSSSLNPDKLSSAGSRWKKGRLLGCGTFGHVYLGFSNESGEMCAMKEVTLHAEDPRSKECAEQLGQEISLLSQLHHPNIVQYYGSEMVDEYVYIYLEYVSGGSIHKVLHQYGPLGEAALRSFTKQILYGLAYLHAKNTAHRDVKGANILLQPGGLVKLADFGMAKHITGVAGPMSFKGSPYWIAPEVVRHANADVSVDIWSLGCTVLEMATGNPPWSQYEGVAAIFKIGHSDELPPIPESLSEDCKDFIRKCLQRDPLMRPTAAMLLDHKFLESSTPSIGDLSPQSQSPQYMNAIRLPLPILIHNEASGSSIPTSPDVGAVQFQNPRTPEHMSAILPATSIATPRGTPCSAAGNEMAYHPRSPQHRHERSPQSPQHRHERSPPSLSSSPRTAFGPLEHLAGGNMSLPFQTKSPTRNMHGDPVSM